MIFKRLTLLGFIFFWSYHLISQEALNNESDYRHGIEIKYSKPFFFESTLGSWMPLPNGIQYSYSPVTSDRFFQIGLEYQYIQYRPELVYDSLFGRVDTRQYVLVSIGLGSKVIKRDKSSTKVYLNGCFRFGDEDIILYKTFNEGLLVGLQLRDIGASAGIRHETTILKKAFIAPTAEFGWFLYRHDALQLNPNLQVKSPRFMINLGISLGLNFD
ncbi:MAG: hypothetical protein WEC59_02370 [Salibacteraceae bacterium]